MAKLGGAEGGGFVKKKNFKISDGDNTFRIFPSIGFNGKEPNGKWAVFHRVHFGYKTSDGKMRVFESPLVKNKEKMVTSPDAALERVETLKADLQKAIDRRDKDEAQRLTALVGGKKPIYNLDSNHYMNVINENGEIGVLKLRHKGKLVLDALKKTLESEGIKPLSADDGRFFVINRQGMGLDTTYSVKVKTRKVTVEGRTLNEDVVHVITEDIIKRLDTEAADLETLFVKPTSEEVAQIVKESDLNTGRSKAVDRIFAKKENAATASQVEPEQEGEDEPTSTSAPQAQAAQPQTQAAPQQQAAPAQVSQPAEPTQQAAQTTIKLDATTAVPKQQTITEMSDDDFLKSLEA